MERLRRHLPALKTRAKALGRRISDADVNDRAGALTYYSFLSLFPALIIVVALLGLFASYPDTYNEIIETLRNAAPEPVVQLIDSALEDAVRSRGGAGGLLSLGLLVTFYSASGATGAAVRGVQAVYGIRDQAPWWRGYLVRFGVTLVVGTMVLIAFAAVLLAGPVFNWISTHIGVSDSVNDMVALVRWPVGILALFAVNGIVYRVGSGRRGRLRYLLPGAVLAVVVVIVATLGFNFYVSNFASYSATYGSLGAVIVLLVWMWISSLAVFTGAALNAELDPGVNRFPAVGVDGPPLEREYGVR